MTPPLEPPLPAPRDPHVPERRFREDEVEAILDRASRQEDRPDLPAPHDPTLGDLMAAAAEAGLDPAEVRRAAAVIPGPPGGVGSLIIGAPDERESTARLPGGRVPTDPYAVVQAAEAALGRRGKVVESVPDLLVWNESHPGGRSTLRVEARDGALHVTATAHRTGYYLGLFLAGMVGWSLLAMVSPLAADIPVLARVLGLFVMPALAARPFWTAHDRTLTRRLEALVLDVLRLGDAEGPAALPRGEDGGTSE